MSKFNVIDLFAGAGGLSLGFDQTNNYCIKAAFESNPAMQKTYILNHPNTEVFGDVCNADYSQLIKKHGEIDVVIGGPPCQGFSNANRQKNQAISANNMLVKQYIRAISELKPKAFVMENVSMLSSDTHRFFLENEDEDKISHFSIPTKETKIYMLDKPYVFSEAKSIVSSRFLAKKYLWPENHYHLLNVIYKCSKNTQKLSKALSKHKSVLLKYAQEYDKDDNEDYILIEGRRAFSAIIGYYDGSVDIRPLNMEIVNSIMIQRMLRTAIEIFDHNIKVEHYCDDSGVYAIVQSYAIQDYLERILKSDEYGYVIESGVLSAADFGAPQKRKRFILMGIHKSAAKKVELPIGQFAPGEYRTVRDAIGDLEDTAPLTDIKEDNGFQLSKKELDGFGTYLRDSDTLYNHISTNTRETAMTRFREIKQGENFHSLSDELKTNTYTDVSRTQNTIYLRLKYDEPSGTVVNVRKSMWIHPKHDRAISIREAARLQTFPDSFRFCGTKDQQYQQVGNAVPPILARAIAQKLDSLLSDGNN